MGSGAVGMGSGRALFALLRGGATIPRPRNRAEPLSGDRMAGLFAKAINAVVNALQRAVYFEELVGFASEFGPEYIAIRLFLRGVGHVDAEHVAGSRCFGRVPGVSPHQSIAEMDERPMVPCPFGRDTFVAGGIRRVALRLFCFRRGACPRLD